MNNEINEKLIIHKDFNDLFIEELTERENKVFTSILFLIQGRQSDIVKIDYDDIFDLLKMKNLNPKMLWRLIEWLGDKLNSSLFIKDYEKSELIKIDNIFNVWEHNFDEETIRVSINDDMKYLLNDIDYKDKMVINLTDFLSMKNIHSQALYKLLMEYNSVGEAQFSVSEFCLSMNIPKSYEKDPKRIRERIIEKAISSNGDLFFRLFSKLKYEVKFRRSKTSGFVFTWKPKKEAIEENVVVEDELIDNSEILNIDLAVKSNHDDISISMSLNDYNYPSQESNREDYKIRADMLDKLKNSF